MTKGARRRRTIGWGGAALLAVVTAALPVPGAQAALPQQGSVVDLLTQANVTFDAPSLAADSGTSVSSAGDVNGDGIDDLLIGADDEDPNGRSSAGSAFVVFGSASPANAALGALGARGFRIDGAVAGDRLGSGVAAAGDVNGDGRDDLLVGAYAADAFRGRAYVVFGKADAAAVDTAALGDKGFQIDGQATNDWLGLALAGGRDVNGDGRDDIVVGAFRADNNARSKSGSAYVIFGRSATTTIDTASLGSAGYRIDGPGASVNGAAANAVALPGDMNGDGRSEVAVGVPFLSSAGAAYVVFGKASTTAVDLAAVGSAGYKISGAAGDNLGTGLESPGDTNGDGRADLLLEANLADNNGRTDSGSAYILRGKADANPVSLSTFVADGAGLRIDGAVSGLQAGRSLAAPGDVNGDGRGDLVLGTYGADVPGRLGAGLVYVVYGTGATGTQDLASLGAGGYLVQGAEAGGSLGPIGRAGDVNGDGRPDIVLAAPATLAGGTTYALFGFGPAALAYTPSARTGAVGTPLAPLGPSLVRRTGVAAFSVAPALPAGLTLDAATGTIGGTPAAALPATPFTVTMTDLAGSASAVVTLDVHAAAGGPPAPAPAVRALQLSRLRVTCVTPKTGRVCRIRLSFVLSERATVRVTLRRNGTRKPLGTVTLKARAGANRLLLPAKVAKRPLKAGALRLSVQASAGSRRSGLVAAKVKVRAVRGARR